MIGRSKKKSLKLSKEKISAPRFFRPRFSNQHSMTGYDTGALENTVKIAEGGRSAAQQRMYLVRE